MACQWGKRPQTRSSSGYLSKSSYTSCSTAPSQGADSCAPHLLGLCFKYQRPLSGLDGSAGNHPLSNSSPKDYWKVGEKADHLQIPTNPDHNCTEQQHKPQGSVSELGHQMKNRFPSLAVFHHHAGNPARAHSQESHQPLPQKAASGSMAKANQEWLSSDNYCFFPPICIFPALFISTLVKWPSSGFACWCRTIRGTV